MLTNDETYISVEAAADYINLMGLDMPTDEETLEPLLRRSAILLDRMYGQRYLGELLDSDQFLLWPRYGYEGIPRQVGYAQVELAFVLYANEGKLPEASPKVKKKVRKLEGLETSVEYADANGYGADPFLAVSAALGAFMIPVDGSGQVTPRIYMTRGA